MEAFNALIGPLSKMMGPLTGLMGMISQMSLASKEKSAMDRSIYYSKHPEAINALVKQFQQPLSAGLTSGVGNVVNASMAEQGLSQAPGIQSQVLAQALAPYQQNEQQMAIAEAMKAIGLPAEALQMIMGVKGGTDLSSLLKGVLPGGGGMDIGKILRDAGMAAGGGGPQTTPSILPDQIDPFGSGVPANG